MSTDAGCQMFQAKLSHHSESSSKTHLILPHRGNSLAHAIVIISASFMKRLAEISHTQPGHLVNKHKLADLSFARSIRAREHVSFQFEISDLSTLQQLFGNFQVQDYNTCKPYVDASCALSEINLFKMSPAGAADRQRKCKCQS